MVTEEEKWMEENVYKKRKTGKGILIRFFCRFFLRNPFPLSDRK